MKKEGRASHPEEEREAVKDNTVIVSQDIKSLASKDKPTYKELLIAEQHASDLRKAFNKDKPVEPPLKLIEPMHQTDTGNAQHLVNLYGDQILYCDLWKCWMINTGKRWEKDSVKKIDIFSKLTVRDMYSSAIKEDDTEKRIRLIKHALASESRTRIKAMIEMAQSEVPVLPDRFDRDIMLLNTDSGTIDLRTGDIREHRQDDYITKISTVKFVPAAKCPKWEAFLEKIFSGNIDLIRFIQKAVGYTLTGNISEQCIFILHGNGKNGKTTFMRVIEQLMNDYARQTPPETLMMKRYEGGVPNDVAGLQGARLVSAAESGDGRQLNESLIKQLTGGDKISARFLHAEFFEFTPVCKIFLLTNHKPDIRGTDNAIWRRIRLIPFTVQIPEGERIKDYHEILISEELPGILNWAIEGCLKWQKEGLGIPEPVRNATEEYQSEMDLIGEFLEVCFEADESAYFSNKLLYLGYQLWCAAGSETAMNQMSFTRSLEERGFRKEKKTNGRVWHGLRPKEELLKIVLSNDGFGEKCRVMTGLRGFSTLNFSHEANPYKPSQPVIKSQPVINDNNPVTEIREQQQPEIVEFLKKSYDHFPKPNNPEDLQRLMDSMALNIQTEFNLDDDSRYVQDYCRSRGWL